MPKNNVIYPQETFEKQTNGVTFYKEGLLEDFPTAGKGVFESWRYNFDAGKQVFRAEKTGKVYEKRIVKDVHGNPVWTGWMEIPDAEVNGVQAIAINDRPLQLPNSDGAIKLQITPATINAYTKEETISIVDEKIQNTANKAYIYVKWVIDPDTEVWAANPRRVLEITYPDGGISAQYYLVEPHPSTSGINEHATYWIWDEVIPQNQGGAGGYYDWLSVEVPDLKAFVSYPVFNEHTDDTHFHLKGQFERDNWDKITLVSGLIDEHISDIGDADAPHITIEERTKWNNAYDNISEFPQDEKRYVASQNDFVLAYEQIETEDELTVSFYYSPSVFISSNNILTDNLNARFQELIDAHNIITHVQLDVGSVSTPGTSAWFETDTGLKSEIFMTNNPPIWRFNFTKPFERIFVIAADPTKTVTLQNVNLYVTYKHKKYVNIGDNNSNVADRLALNLVGPEGDVLYNGKSLFEALSGGIFAKSAEWGRITGDIDNQNDLSLKLAKLLKDRITNADMKSHLRWDVYRDHVIAGLIQQPGNEFSETIITSSNSSYVEKGTAVIENIQSKLLELKEEGYVPYATRLEATFISSYQDPVTNEQLPVYFETDNPLINPSPTVASAPFTWDWPGNTFEVFDKIYLRGNNVERFEEVHLTIFCIKYGDAVAEAKGYQFTINGTNIHLNASGLLNSYMSGAIENILHNKEVTIGNKLAINVPEAEISGQELQITEQEIVSVDTATLDITASLSGTIAARDLDLKAERTSIGVTPKEYDEAGDTIIVYGQEIDQRYASRAPFEILSGNYEVFSGDMFDELETLNADLSGEIHDREEAITIEAYERNSGFIYFSGVIEDRAENIYNTVSGEVSGYVYEVYQHIDKELDNYYTKDDSHLTFYSKDETYNRTEIDGLIHDVYGEQWDLVIGSNDEFIAAIESNLIKNAKRVLFKTGEYTYDGTTPIDFENSAFVKGEEPVIIKANKTTMVNYDDTLFETIRLEVGAVGIEFIIDTSGNRIKAYDIQGTQQVQLDKYHKIYKLNLVDNAVVAFTNVTTGRDYIFWLDQRDAVKNFNISNYLHNATELATALLENQKSRMRTIFNVTGNNETEQNGLVINEIIPGTYSDLKVGYFTLLLGNVSGKLHKSNVTVPFVNPHNTYPLGFNIGETVNIRSSFISGEAWKPSSTYDWVIIDPLDNNKELFSGSITPIKDDPTSIFTITDGDNVKGTELIINFIPTERLIKLVLDPNVVSANVLDFNTISGLDQNGNEWSREYQGWYEEVLFDIKCLDDWEKANGDGWFIYKTIDSMGNNYEASLPWKFFIRNGELPTNDLITLTPCYYKTINNISGIQITSNPGRDLHNTISNGGTIYERNKIGGPKSPAYLNNRYTHDFVFYDDGNGQPVGDKHNDLVYIKTPEDSNNPQLPASPDPISIFDYDEKQIKVIDSNHIRILDKDLKSFKFKTLTGAGLELPWSGIVIRPVKNGYISGLQNYVNTDLVGEGVIDDTIVHVGYSESNKYAYEINWDGYEPTYTSGTWTVEGGKAVWENNGIVTADNNVLIASTKGETEVKFVSQFNPTKVFTKIIKVKVHQDGVTTIDPTTEAKPKHVLTSTFPQVTIVWTDRDGVDIPNPGTSLADTSGYWTLDNEKDAEWATINATTGLITVTNHEVPEEGKLVKFNFKANAWPMNYSTPYPHQINTGKPITTSYYIKIFRNSYFLEFEHSDTNYLGVAGVPEKGLHQAELVLNPVITLKNGTKLTDDFEDYLRNDLGLKYAGTMVETSDGIGRLHFNMPYKDIEIVIKTTTI